MKRYVALSLLVVFCSVLRAQHPIDGFLTGTPTSTVIGTEADGLDQPVDLDFNRVPGKTDELWVLNYGLGGSSVSIFFHAGTPQQVSQYREDSHNGHFMINCPALAMGANGNFGTVQEVRNSVGNQTSTFMGPVLWMTDTSVFARMYQSNWDAGKPLGSHIDMLHQSPFSMGIAAEKDNIYWVFDGHNGNLVKYDFAVPHTIGGDDHSDGKVWRYPEVMLERVPGLPAHMILDSASGWLYIVDNAKQRVIRVNTKSGIKAKTLAAIDEPLALYWEMKNTTQQVYIDTGLVAPSGIDIMNGRLVVTDNANGDIRIYDATGAKGVYLGKIATGAQNLLGIKIGPDGSLWYVDATANTVTRLESAPYPEKITLLYPAFNATSIPTSDTLKWELEESKFDYLQLRIWYGNPWPLWSLDTLILPTDRFAFSGLKQGVKYHWHVYGYKDSALIASVQDWFFTTEVKTPGVPLLLSPPDVASNVTDSVTLFWNASQDATHYQLQLTKQMNFSTTVLDIDSTTSLFHRVPVLSPLTKYYWRVRAYNELTVSQWSEPWTFTTTASSVHTDGAVFAVQVFPNPMQAATTVVYTLPEETEIGYELVNALGVTVREGTHTGSFGRNEFTIGRGTLVAGSYRLVLRIGDSVFNRSIVILP